MITPRTAVPAEPSAEKKTKPVFLVGFMGSGKSSVGRMLAKACDAPFLDVDAELEAHFGMPISRIFSEGREKEFREAEAAFIVGQSNKGRFAIIATGGGACSDPEALRAMRDGGIVFWLDADLPVLLGRIAGDPHRPMLARDPQALFAARRGLYEACAHFRIDANRAADMIATELAALI